MAIGGATLLAGAAVAGTARPTSTRALDDVVHLNQIQVIGSHNSYHEPVTGKEYQLRHAFLGNADQAFMYRADPLATQLQSDKVRQIELDTWLDPVGGRYATPLLRKLAGLGPYDPAMNKPGIKIIHVQDVDYHVNCLTLVLCLGQVKAWSHAHPTHVPLAILIELKDSELHVGNLPIVQPIPWTSAGLDTLDNEIRSVFSPADLITPDDVRGASPTLSGAVTTTGWPTLAQSRGKVLFLMDNGGHYRTDYLAGHPSLKGRILFTNANPGDDDAAFVERNTSTDPSIPTLVKAGYVVRTRADEPTDTARKNDTSLRDAGLASGAQWVSTDYPRPGLDVGFNTPYFAEIPGGTVARCNPVNGPPSCVSAQLDTNFTPLPVPTTTTTTSITPTSTVPATTTVPDEGTEPAAGATPVPGRSSFTG